MRVLRLAAQPQKQHVVPGEDRVDDLGNDRLVIAEDSRKQRLAPAELRQQVPPHFALDADAAAIRWRATGRGFVVGRSSVSQPQKRSPCKFMMSGLVSTSASPKT